MLSMIYTVRCVQSLELQREQPGGREAHVNSKVRGSIKSKQLRNIPAQELNLALTFSTWLLVTPQPTSIDIFLLQL
ncbi:hypothetical protein MPTK1_5g02070 [Marchantia polymorpha subsp. ruderalis]|uniref:Uncharacterized protein n=2 Tax=Marchantia polymorpha TaxID=3197 RepID=A0AAF6BE07_MARPO|nr:hypothetical protein MARPO_0346s0001 [Marchantia polymorpha]PTQ26807.1 hypothetical protein MARPO_0346s0001 [Marchantia polymorpha]BBN10240.1 hypothetical protein Mp_5g02070 [Marchantia polymorpha subsp. ruderalis]BBN10241.1 hypothetical protein Mp_5g02070 [Marchantia polymorpha subsp. ruderalis]|eukprot:PTQ26806.1 hypothetical protein MARPO_0346s0001 [Marchantia polymorpha]